MKTHLPYFRGNQFIKPPEGYFILPGHAKYGYKFKDKYRYEGGWHDSTDNFDYDVKRKCEIDGYIICYARPIKDNEELYSQMAFLPEQIVTAPEGYYLLPANELLIDGDIGYASKWSKDTKNVVKNPHGTSVHLTPLTNYEEYEDIIAFARKINMNNPKFQVKVCSKAETTALYDLVVKYSMSTPASNYYRNGEFLIGLDSSYMIFDYSCNYIGWNPDKISDAEKYDIYETCDLEAIEDHLIIVSGKDLRVDYTKWQGFQVKIKNMNQFDTLVKLAKKYNLENADTVGIPTFDLTKYFIFRFDYSHPYITWDNNVYYPDKFYVYGGFNVEKFENHLKATMNVTNEKVDYSKTPNFAVKIDNDNTRVMLLALAEKYKFKPYNPAESQYVIVAKTDLVSVSNKEFKAGFYYNQAEKPVSNSVYTYETPDWNAIIKHFEAPITVEKTKPMVNGYTMSYSTSNPSIAVFGCAHIDINMLKEIYSSIKIKRDNLSNRWVVSIALDSGKVITVDQIKEILEYVEWADKQ